MMRRPSTPAENLGATEGISRERRPIGGGSLIAFLTVRERLDLGEAFDFAASRNGGSPAHLPKCFSVGPKKNIEYGNNAVALLVFQVGVAATAEAPG
jgi:hypothetical protein